LKLLITENLAPSQLEEVRLIAREHLVVATQERDIALAEAVDADMAMVSAFAREVLETAKQLKWAHIPWAGVDNLLDAIRKTPAVVTCAKGVFDAPMADHVFALLLALTRRLDAFWRYQVGGRLAAGGDGSARHGFDGQDDGHRWARQRRTGSGAKGICLRDAGFGGQAPTLPPLPTNPLTVSFWAMRGCG
jgi:phosphoglycerate dehydrogenase-like enzyme